MKKLLIVKLGGSVITDKSKPFTARTSVIKRLAHEIKEIKKVYTGDLIVVHGGGSFPHIPASKYQTQKGFINSNSLIGLSLTANAAIRINRIVVGEFLKAGMLVVSFAPGSYIYSKGARTKRVLLEPIRKALGVGVVPMMYGDVVMDEEMGFCIYSGEKIIAELVEALHDEYKIDVIYLTDTNGVYDANGKTIPRITSKNFEKLSKTIGSTKTTDVTGGMVHKVEESLNLVKKFSVKITIINGNKGKCLEKVVKGYRIMGTEINVS